MQVIHKLISLLISKRMAALVSFLSIKQISVAQKPAIDTGTYRKWAFVGYGALNNDGNFVSYKVYDDPPGSVKLVIKSIDGNWAKEFSNSNLIGFSHDNNAAIVKGDKDSLWLLTLGTENLVFISRVSECSLLSDDQRDLIVFRPSGDKQALILRELPNGAEKRFSFVSNYQFANQNRKLLLEIETKKDSGNWISLKMADLASGKMINVWSDSGHNKIINQFTTNADGSRVAFIVETKEVNVHSRELWYYDANADTSSMLANDRDPVIKVGLVIADQEMIFSKDGNEIFFYLMPVESNKPSPESVQVDVWSYKDSILQPLQLNLRKPKYSSVIDIQNKKIIQLEQNNESTVGGNDHFKLIKKDLGLLGFENRFESSWNLAAQTSYYLISTQTGDRRLIKNHISTACEALALSPLNKWIIFYDKKEANYFSYEIATGKLRNITKTTGANWLEKTNDMTDCVLTWLPGRDTWLQSDTSVFIYDNNDIWQIDPSCIKAPVNLTNGYGRKNNIKFQILDESSVRLIAKPKIFSLFLTAVDAVNKNRGFYKITADIGKDPVKCFMGPYIFGDWFGSDDYYFGPSKAVNKNIYLLTRMSAKEAPNYFITLDFIRFSPLTNIQPQKNYNWMSTELIHWKTFDGTVSTGILYKPEDFDPYKKYPVIFDYYERRSDELNLYVRPRYARGDINLAWYVSHGYLVCVPDIYFKQGQPGQSAYNSVVSAALYISKKPWVDAKRMGIQGHSFGGYETNFIITHTPIFAAACSASGITDLASLYGSATRPGYQQFTFERGQFRMGNEPWNAAILYMRNSPVYYVHKVTTPLLMMANKNDQDVPFDQSVEFFTSLRRLGKRVWILQYDMGGHTLGNYPKDLADYSTRMAQFFDHYLKGKPAPIWMTRGIPARLRGVDNGLEPDSAIKTPGAGLINPGSTK